MKNKSLLILLMIISTFTLANALVDVVGDSANISNVYPSMNQTTNSSTSLVFPSSDSYNTNSGSCYLYVKTAAIIGDENSWLYENYTYISTGMDVVSCHNAATDLAWSSYAKYCFTDELNVVFYSHMDNSPPYGSKEYILTHYCGNPYKSSNTMNTTMNISGSNNTYVNVTTNMGANVSMSTNSTYMAMNTTYNLNNTEVHLSNGTNTNSTNNMMIDNEDSQNNMSNTDVNMTNDSNQSAVVMTSNSTMELNISVNGEQNISANVPTGFWSQFLDLLSFWK